ncbi:MAG: methyl-accepting chemotaxis protein [Bacillota bacterium]
MKRKGRSVSLGVKLVALMVAFTVIPTVAVALLSIRSVDSELLKMIEKDLTSQIEMAVALVETQQAQVDAGAVSLEEAQAKVKEALKPLKVGETGYFYALDGNGRLTCHPAKEGQDLSAEGFIQQMLKQRNGYIRYAWINKELGETKARDKVVAFRDFKDWGWILAAGSYLDEFQGLARAVQNTTVVTGVVASVVAILVGIFAVQAITKPISRLSAIAAQVASGDLTVEVPQVRTRDEVETLRNSFAEMIGSLRGIIGDISRVSEEVSSSSEEMSATAEESSNAIQQVAKAAQDAARTAEAQAREVGGATEAMKGLKEALTQIAKGSQDQARVTHETSGAVKEIAQAIQGISGSAGSLASASEETRKSADSGRDAVSQTVDGIKQIGDVASKINESISVLAARSDKIGEIVGVIDEIANQTNLLALNAAIEAARAGDHGKGFAVVADEVRKLAERSAKSTKEISELISEIQRGTTASVNAIDEGTKAVQKGVELGAFATRAIQAILDLAESTDENVRSIVASINQVSASSDQVEKAVEQIAATAEESTAATEEVTASAKQVEELLQSVGTAAGTASAGAEEISASSEELGASSEEMASSAQSLAKMAQGLKALVDRFRV